MFEATETVSYGICEAPYAIAGTIADEQKLVSYTPERLREEKGVIVKTLCRAEKIVRPNAGFSCATCRTGSWSSMTTTGSSSPQVPNRED